MSPEELECEEHFKKTHTRKLSGRYMVRLPVSGNQSIKLGPTRTFAVNMLKSTEKKMSTNPDYFKKYSENINDFISKGHLLKIP